MTPKESNEVDKRFSEFLDELGSMVKVRIMSSYEKGAIDQFRQGFHELEELLHIKRKTSLP